MRKAIRQICEPRINRVSQKVKETPILKMEYRNKRPDSHTSLPTHEEESVMDAGAMSSILPLHMAEEHDFEVAKPRKKITLKNASGDEMDVQGVAIVWARAKGAKVYRKITFIVSSEAQELLISFKDQVTLRILPANYPYHLGDGEGEVTEFAEEEDIIEPYDDEPDQEA